MITRLGRETRPKALLADATRLGGVALTITDLDRSLDFYTRVIGLSVHARDERSAALGTGGEDLVTLRAQPGARPAGRHAGLYHYALLFPTREELARVARRIATSRTRVEGASDHGTHEAIYLPDPDGIGIELAADRPRERWPDLGSTAFYANGPQPLALGALFAAIGEEPTRTGAEGALAIGHLHLHVGDLEAANGFYRDGLGFELMTSMPTAAFVSAGGYHHHLAYNVWRGAGVGPAPDDVVGLAHWTLVTADQAPPLRGATPFGGQAGERAAVLARLATRGVVLEERDGGAGQPAGTVARDPFGIAVLIV